MSKPTIWVAILRTYEGSVIAEGMITLQEMITKGRELELRMRFNPDMRLVTMRLPTGTRREQMYEAFNLLSRKEKCRLYNLPQHSMRQ